MKRHRTFPWKVICLKEESGKGHLIAVQHDLFDRGLCKELREQALHPLSAFILQLPCWESTSQENRTLWSFASRGVRWTAAGFPQAVEMNGQTGAGMMGRDFGRRVPTEGGLCTFRLALFIRNTKCLVSRSSQTSVAWKVTALHSHSWQAG